MKTYCVLFPICFVRVNLCVHVCARVGGWEFDADGAESLKSAWSENGSQCCRAQKDDTQATRGELTRVLLSLAAMVSSSKDERRFSRRWFPGAWWLIFGCLEILHKRGFLVVWLLQILLLQGRTLRSFFITPAVYGKCSWMDLGEHSWSMVKREVSSSPGSPAEQTYLSGDRRDGPPSDDLRTPPSELDALGHRRSDSRSLHSYLHFGHHTNPLSTEDIPLFTDLDQGSKLVLSAGAHKASLLVDPTDMYQTLAIAAAQSQAGYDSSSAGYMHSNPNSPVYVPSSRVNPMIPSLSYLQASGSAQTSHAVSSHSVWSQSAPESPSYSSGSPHASSRFHYPPSPPMNNGTPRDSSYGNTLNVSGRDQYGLSRPLSGTYTSPYSPYVAPQLPSPWTGGPFDNTMLHTLQSRGAPLIRGPNGGKQKIIRRSKLFTHIFFQFDVKIKSFHKNIEQPLKVFL